jgi:hypothetical protein
MNYTLLLNSSNQVPGKVNVFRYNFIQSTDLSKKRLAVANLSLYYSWFNFTQAYGNLSLSYEWIDGTVVNIAIPPGYYSVSTLNSYLQYIMVEQGHYLIDNNNLNHYYLGIQENETYYAVEIDSTPLPSSLPSGWSYPTGSSPSWTTSAKNPQLIIPANGSSSFPISMFFGLLPGSYPSAQTPASQQAFLSTFTPQVTPVSSVIVSCSICSNLVTQSPQQIFMFTPVNTEFGSMININPTQFLWADINDFCSCQSFDITFTDQLGNNLQIQDDYVTMLLAVANRNYPI